jgi:A/G-specific adenine glycosylase
MLRRWQGLGYPRRARDLHGTAARIVANHGGRVPDDLTALLALPGIGPYTARAVLAFAFERDVGVVETNIARVLARVEGERLTMRRAQALADELVPASAGWAWNQALMDLGAAVCRPTPRCADCPIAGRCRWHASGHLEPDPAAGSAGVSTPQAPPYDGSDRQARGRVLRRLVRGPAPEREFAPQIVAGLVADRLVVRAGTDLRLP